MLGIGHRLERETKQKILAQKAKQYNTKYDQLLGTGLQPEQAAKTLTSEDFQRRHLERPEIQPYNISKKINHLGGTVNQGYFEAQSVLSTTKNMYQPIEQELKKVRQNKPDREALSQAKKEFERMKYRIYKDHLQEDAQIDFGEVKVSDYKRNFVEDDKLKQEVRNRDKRYNQWQNDLKDYAEHYLKSKQCLRKC